MTRFFDIGGSLNFRHLGGYETQDGRHTRGDMLFRGGWFDVIDDTDVQRFTATGISCIFDLRSTPEREQRPLSARIREQASVSELGITPGSMGSYLLSLPHLPAEEINCKDAMIRMHEEMLEEAIPVFRAFFQQLIAHDGPIMLMCATGKDRTGVASALLLSALGVPIDTIFADYLISAEVYRGKELSFARHHGLDALGIDLNLVKDVFTVYPEYLGAVLRQIDEEAGGMEIFLSEVLSLPASSRDHLKKRFLIEHTAC